MFSESSTETVRWLMKMDENATELIAIGASLAANCQPCLTFHVDKARNLGIVEDEINEAIAVGRMIRKGPCRPWTGLPKAFLQLRKTNHPNVAIMLQGIAALNSKEEIRHGK
jgi:AhpD family alkylhydroperoxidase